MKLTEPQLYWLRKAAAAGVVGVFVPPGSGTRVARTLARYGLVNIDDDESHMMPTEAGHKASLEGEMGRW